jgi:hypothetical protein
MRKSYLFILTIPLLCSCTDLTILSQKAPSEEAVTIREISEKDNLTLTRLHAKHQAYTYKDKTLLLGDKQSTAQQKQIFLIYNKSTYPIILDFPEGHIGATAGITQMIQPNEWYAYLYVKNKDYRPVESKTGKIHHIRPRWTCQKGDPDYDQYDSCKNYLDIYTLNYNLETLKTSHYILDYKVLQILTHYNKARWLTHISYPSVQSLLMNIHVTQASNNKK